MNMYDILEVSPCASKEVIEKAYRVLAKKYHPDLHDSDSKEWAENKIKQLNQAYEAIINGEKRAEYDEQLKKQNNADVFPYEFDKEKKKDIIIESFLKLYRNQ